MEEINEEKLLWTELQKKIKDIFSNVKVKKFKDVLEKDKNGWNWVLSFHNMYSPNYLIVHTRFIFKLTKDKKYLRKNEFLYLKDLNCLYKLVKFDDLESLRSQINEIMYQDMFGENLLAVSRFMISPAMAINQHFYDRKIEGFSVYDFNYEPQIAIVPCQKLKLEFKFNVNNQQDVNLTIDKEGNQDFLITFTYMEESVSQHEKSLANLESVVGTYIQKNLDKK